MEKIRRREFLKKGGITLALGALITSSMDVLSAHTSSQSISKPVWEHLETGMLFQDIQEYQSLLAKRYGVIFNPAQTPEEIAAKFGLNLDLEMINRTMILPIKWDGPRLYAINSTFNILPQLLYSPRILTNASQPLRLSLYEEHTPERSAGTYLAFNHELHLSRAYLGQTILEQIASKKIIVHELTHSITGSSFGTNGQFIESALRLQKILQINTLSELRSTFASIIEEEKDPGWREFRLKSWQTHIGYGASNFGEFWSVAAEYYIDGKDTFIKEYAPYLNPERSEKFYKGLMEELFQGREYKAGLLQG